jgi:hypothetical protein
VRAGVRWTALATAGIFARSHSRGEEHRHEHHAQARRLQHRLAVPGRGRCRSHDPVLEQAFGATELRRFPDPSGKIMHAEVRTALITASAQSS